MTTPITKEQERVLDRYRDYNTDHDWWECIYTDIRLFAAELGLDDFAIWGFGPLFCQGERFEFRCSGTVGELFSRIRSQKWKDERPLLDFSPAAPPEGSAEDFLAKYTYFSCRFQGHFNDVASGDWGGAGSWRDPMIEETVSALEAAYGASIESTLLEIFRDLEKLFLGWLRDEYLYLSSDEVLLEVMEANDFSGVDDDDRAVLKRLQLISSPSTARPLPPHE